MVFRPKEIFEDSENMLFPRITLPYLTDPGRPVCADEVDWAKEVRHGPPVRYTGQAMLRELRTAQNEAIRHIAGASRTTPIDPTSSWASCPSTFASKCLSKMPRIASTASPSTPNW